MPAPSTPHTFIPGETVTDTMMNNIRDWIIYLNTGAATQAAWPIGSVFIAVVSTNPASLLGFGTWAAFGAGRVIVGRDGADVQFDVAEETGGEKTHILTENELATHTHVQYAHTHVQNAHAHSERASAGGGSTNDFEIATNRSSTPSGVTSPSTTGNTTAVNQDATAVNYYTGLSWEHNNLQPYIVAYMWKRTA